MLRRHNRYMNTSRRASPVQDPEVNPLVRLWVLRILVPLGGQQGFIEPGGFLKAGVASALGLADPAEDEEADSFSPSAARAALRRLYAGAESRCRKAGLPPVLHANLRRLGDLVGLDGPSRLILAFIIARQSG